MFHLTYEVEVNAIKNLCDDKTWPYNPPTNCYLANEVSLSFSAVTPQDR